MIGYEMFLKFFNEHKKMDDSKLTEDQLESIYSLLENTPCFK